MSLRCGRFIIEAAVVILNIVHITQITNDIRAIRDIMNEWLQVEMCTHVLNDVENCIGFAKQADSYFVTIDYAAKHNVHPSLIII